MLVFIFIKCRFNLNCLLLVNILLFQILPYPRREGKRLFLIFTRINERSNKDKIFFFFFANIFLGKISKDNS